MNDKQACAADPMAFGRRYLGHYFTVPSPAFHRQLGKLWQKRVMKGMTPGEDTLPAMLSAPGCRLALAAPRGHAKSTVMSLQNVLHAALYGYKKYILLVSDTESQATAFLDCIKAELEDNEEILTAFGAQKGKRGHSFAERLPHRRGGLGTNAARPPPRGQTARSDPAGRY